MLRDGDARAVGADHVFGVDHEEGDEDAYACEDYETYLEWPSISRVS